MSTRNREQWLNEMSQDTNLIRYYLTQEDPPGPRDIAMALKEARRLQSDIYRFARDCYGISREQIDGERSL